MDSDELQFLEEQLAASELLPCSECQQETLHHHLEVLETYSTGAEMLMQCSHCLNAQVWLDKH